MKYGWMIWITLGDTYRQMKPSNKSLKNYIPLLIEYIGVFLLVIMGIAASAQIFLRFFGELLGTTGSWTEELARYTLILIGFIGISYNIYYDNDISIRPLFRYLPYKYEKTLLILSNILVIIFLIVLVISISAVIGRTMDVSLPIIRWLSVGYAYAALALSALLALLFVIFNTLQIWRQEELPKSGMEMETNNHE